MLKLSEKDWYLEELVRNNRGDCRLSENLVAMSPEVFCKKLVTTGNNRPFFLNEFGSPINGNLEAMLDHFCETSNSINGDMVVYKMKWGEVYFLYTSVDIGGYDPCLRIKVYTSMEEYNKAVTLK